MKNPYEHLCKLSKRAQMLEGISGLLSWDQETYMPEKASPIRAEQCELLAELAHSIKTSPEYETTLNSLVNISTGTFKKKNLTDLQKDALKLFRKDFVKHKKLPTSFVQEFTKVTSEAIFIWQKAKAKNDFRMFQPSLEHIVKLNRKKAELFGYDEHPYDALLDEYEPGATTKEIETLFKEIKTASKSIIKKWQKKKISPLVIPATDSEQVALCKWVLELIGFDFTKGRFDLSCHPFSTSYHPFDTRLTTRTESHGIVIQILTTLHEAGHSLYDMGLPVEHYGTPLCQAISLGIHESQSRFWETRIGRSKAFWKLIFPALKEKFPKALKSETHESIYEKLNQVEPSLIRVDADEVTYPLHVALRFEIEKELIAGELKVKELPERWNAGMKDLLAIVPKTDSTGCLQDIHWSMGAFGYFPTYTLGNVYAAVLFEAFLKKHPDWEKRIQKKDFGFIQEWLAKNVWQHGRRYEAKELLQKISGKKVSAKPFISYLTEKY